MTDVEKARNFIRETRMKLYEMYVALDAPEQLKALAQTVEISDDGKTAIDAVSAAKVDPAITKQDALWKTQREIIRKFIQEYTPPKKEGKENE